MGFSFKTLMAMDDQLPEIGIHNAKFRVFDHFLADKGILDGLQIRMHKRG